jgi:hypothetical protein
MGLHGGGVDEHLRRRSADLCERAEQIDPNAFGGPTHIAVVERLFRSVFRRRIDPAPTRFQHMNNAADDPVVVNARFAARVSRKVRRSFRKLRVRKPKLISIHQRFLSETRESRSRVQRDAVKLQCMCFLGLVDGEVWHSQSIEVIAKSLLSEQAIYFEFVHFLFIPLWGFTSFRCKATQRLFAIITGTTYSSIRFAYNPFLCCQIAMAEKCGWMRDVEAIELVIISVERSARTGAYVLYATGLRSNATPWA